MEIVNGRSEVRILNKRYILDFNVKALFDLNNNKVSGALELYRIYVKQENIEEPNGLNNHSYIGAIKKHFKKELKLTAIAENFNKVNFISASKNNIDLEINRTISVNKTKRSKNQAKDETIEQKIKDLVNSLPLEKIKDKRIKKLLIIGCSTSKNIGGNELKFQNYFQSNKYKNIEENRVIRLQQYDELLKNEPDYFLFIDESPIKRNRIKVEPDYFVKCRINREFLPAYKRYNGRYFSKELRELYLEKNKDSNLHILILSGLFGVIEFQDSIIDYHLKIDKKSFWKKNDCVHKTILNYIGQNNIEDDLVFYSLSKEYVKALKPKKVWKDIWISHGRGDTSVSFLKEQMLPNL